MASPTHETEITLVTNVLYYIYIALWILLSVIMSKSLIWVFDHSLVACFLRSKSYYWDFFFQQFLAVLLNEELGIGSAVTATTGSCDWFRHVNRWISSFWNTHQRPCRPCFRPACTIHPILTTHNTLYVFFYKCSPQIISVSHPVTPSKAGVGRRRKHRKEKLVVYIDRYIDI